MAFGRELNSRIGKDFTIKLPVKQDENGFIVDIMKRFSKDGYLPDWNFMEDYIRRLLYGDRI